MKLILTLIALLVLNLSAFAQTYVKGHYRKDGTYVQGHYRSNRDNTNHNNWSTTSNQNPYTGSRGSVAKDYSSGASNYGSGKTIHTGPQGGQYYYNSNGNKTYVPKQPSSTIPTTNSNQKNTGYK